jgi:thiol-disulfide isomerase/thioredoxin
MPDEHETETPIETPRVRAPEINRPGLAWFNLDTPLSLKDLEGRMVILDFWTSGCVNCMHVLPALRKVEAAYPEEVVVIGVHTPKFGAEQDPDNLQTVLARLGIAHPVVNDINYTLWSEYAVRAWPTLVFIGPDGHVMGQLAGEPDPERLLTAVSELVERWDTQGKLTPRPLHTKAPEAATGQYAFPGKLKPLPGETKRWVLADAGHHQVVILNDDGSEVGRFGNGAPGFADGGADRARFRSPEGLAANRDTILVADTGNHAVRRIDLATGRVSTVAGTGERGMVVQESEPSLAAELASPWDIALDGDVAYIANAGTHQILSLDLPGRELAPLAGNGGEDIVDGDARDAQLAQPSGLAVDPGANTLYFVDAETSSVRAVDLSDRSVSTLVGEGAFVYGDENGPFPLARFQHPLGIDVSTGELLVADSYNDRARVLDLAARRVRDLDDGFTCDDESAPALAQPAGVQADGPNRVLLVDTNNHRVLVYDLAAHRYRTWTG